MIKSITLNDFQNHKDTHITFVNGVNGIIGPSDVGKSAIVRAFRWILHNRPSGDEFISHWAKATSVKIEFDEGSITRIKGQKNQYIINDEVELEGFGQEVPDVVHKLSKMSDINIQYQLDGPFLLGESAGAVARTLNKVVNLDKIDSSLTHVRRLESEVKSNIEHTKKKLQEINIELEKAPDFVTIDRLIVNSNRLEFQTQQLNKTIIEIEILKKDIDFCHKTLDNINIPKIDFSSIETNVETLKVKTEELKRLEASLKQITSQNSRIKSLERELTGCLKTLKSLCPNECPLCGQPITPTSLFDACGVGNNAKMEIGG